MKDLIKVGTITSTHGIKGEVKVMGDNSCFSPKYKETLYIETTPLTPVHINTVKNQTGKLIVSFKEFNNINLVECFKNLGILAKRDTLEIEEDEVYLSDLVGMEVYNETDKYLGEVIDYREYPQCFYLVIIDEEEKTHLIPFIDEFIKDITDKIIIHEMEGLLG